VLGYWHGYRNNHLSPLLQHRHRKERPHAQQRQAEVPLSRLRSSKPGGSFSQRLHRGAQGGDLALLPGTIESAWAQAHLRCVAHHGHKLAQKKLERLDLEETLVFPEATEAPRKQQQQILELDELWSFVYRKSEKVWVWLALCRQTRQIVAFVEGDRSRASCERLWRAILKSYKVATCYSDLWEAYQEEAIPKERHEAVGKEEGQTSHVERWINTLRQRLSRFVRKTLSFSKSHHMHHCCLKLFVYRYNLERKGVILG
jgi:insertion element IS1 protein InsB